MRPHRPFNYKCFNAALCAFFMEEGGISRTRLVLCSNLWTFTYYVKKESQPHARKYRRMCDILESRTQAGMCRIICRPAPSGQYGRSANRPNHNTTVLKGR